MSFFEKGVRWVAGLLIAMFVCCMAFVFVTNEAEYTVEVLSSDRAIILQKQEVGTKSQIYHRIELEIPGQEETLLLTVQEDTYRSLRVGDEVLVEHLKKIYATFLLKDYLYWEVDGNLAVSRTTGYY